MITEYVILTSSPDDVRDAHFLRYFCVGIEDIKFYDNFKDDAAIYEFKANRWRRGRRHEEE